MPKLDQQGIIAQLLMLIVLAAGLVGGLYLVKHPQIFKPKAASTGTRVEIIDASGNVIDTTNSKNVKLKLIYVAPSPSPTQSALPSTYTTPPTYTTPSYSTPTTITPAPPLPTSTSPTIGVGGSVKGVGTTASSTASFPTQFKVANSTADLATATEQTFDMNGKIIDWTLTSGNGTKTVYVQFKVDGIYLATISSSISLLEATPSPTPSAQPVSGGTMEAKFMVVAYIPPGGVETLYPGAAIKDPVAYMKNVVIPTMTNATKYHGYANSNTLPSIKFTLADEDIHIENNPPPTTNVNYLYAPPKGADQPGYFDIKKMFEKYNICAEAKRKDIKFIAVVTADSGSYAPKGFESYITGSKGIPTNGPILNSNNYDHYNYCDDKTIQIVGGFSYLRGGGPKLDLETFGHHTEAIFRSFRGEYGSWSDENAPQNTNLWGRGDSCGTVHNPPNARCEYDRSNPNGWLKCGQAGAPSSVMSDCRNWKPGGTGVKETFDCSLWNCESDDWVKWWMQNVPGMGNNLVGTDGKKIPNWWVYIGDPDNCYNNALGCSGMSNPTPTPTTAPTPAPTSNTASFSNLSANALANSVTFNFTYSGTSSAYKIHLSDTKDFSYGVYWGFASGTSSPITETNPKKMGQYQCNKTMYWKVEPTSNPTSASSIQTLTINCTSPSPTPTSTLTPSPTPAPLPAISNITPLTGPVGTKVNVTFKNLTPTGVVYFSNNAQAKATLITSTRLEVLVPKGAGTGPISLLDNFNRLTMSSQPFTVTVNSPPVITYTKSSSASWYFWKTIGVTVIDTDGDNVKVAATGPILYGPFCSKDTFNKNRTGCSIYVSFRAKGTIIVTADDGKGEKASQNITLP